MRVRSVSFLFPIVVIAICVINCASIVSKSEYSISVNSMPEGADIWILNKSKETVYAGKTPTTVVLKAGAGFFKGEDYSVNFAKEGFAAQTAQIKRGVDGWYIAGNIFIGGLIGWLIVDPATGAMWTLENLHVDLESEVQETSQSQLQIMDVEEVPHDLKEQLVRIN